MIVTTTTTTTTTFRGSQIISFFFLGPNNNNNYYYYYYYYSYSLLRTIERMDLTSIMRDEPAEAMSPALGAPLPSVPSLPPYVPPRGQGTLPADPTAGYPADALVKRRAQILLIGAYETEYPALVKPLLSGRAARESLSPPPEVDALLGEIRLAVCAHNSRVVSEWGSEGVLRMLEKFLLACTDFRVQGLHQLSKDPEFRAIMREMSLEYSNLVYIPPIWRGLGKIVQTGAFLHDANTAIEAGKSRPPAAAGGNPEEAMIELERMDQEFEILLNRRRATAPSPGFA